MSRPATDHPTHGSETSAPADVAATMVPIFATPISNTRLTDTEQLNADLHRVILERANASPGVSRSNVGGWHSDTRLFEDPAPCLQALARRIRSHVEGLCRTVARDPADPSNPHFRLEAWANVVHHGGYHSLHSHPNAFWSGVYYVTGNPAPTGAHRGHPFSGKLELVDPRPGASLTYADHTTLYGRFLVNPVPGQLITFPGWLQHQVHPYFGDEPRVTVAFNATFG